MSVGQDTSSRKAAVPLDQRLLVTEDEAAVMVGVSRPTFRRYVAEGLLSPVTLPLNIKRNLYTKAALALFIAGLGKSA